MQMRKFRKVSLSVLGLALLMAVNQAQACGPRAMHRHGGHHHGMHQARADAGMPAGVSAGALPDGQQLGAKLMGDYCTQCHGLPHPSMHAESEWPAVAGRMYQRMQRFRGRVSAPSESEFVAIVAYLQEHARTGD